MNSSEEAQVRKLIEAISFRYLSRAIKHGVDIRDLKQAAWEVILRNFHLWDESKGSISTVFWNTIHTAMGRELKKLSSPVPKNFGDRDEDADPDDTILDNSDPLATIYSKKLLKALLDAANGDFVIADLYAAFMLEEVSGSEAERMSGMSRRNWHSLVERITKRVRNGKKSSRSWRELD